MEHLVKAFLSWGGMSPMSLCNRPNGMLDLGNNPFPRCQSSLSDHRTFSEIPVSAVHALDWG